MLTSKITHIEPKGVWNNGTTTFQKYQVSMANGDSPTFLAKGEFKKSVGQDITYEKNEQYNTAKMIQEKPTFAPQQKPSQKEDVQTYIIRQSMLKAAVDYHSGQPVDVNDVMETARVFINFVNNG
jgi:hypothetical protein